MGLSAYEKERWKRHARERMPGVVAAAGSLLAFGISVLCFLLGVAFSPEPDISRPWLIAAFVALLVAVGLGAFAAHSLLAPRGRWLLAIGGLSLVALWILYCSHAW